jgi:hypothetical protein
MAEGKDATFAPLVAPAGQTATFLADSLMKLDSANLF